MICKANAAGQRGRAAAYRSRPAGHWMLGCTAIRQLLRCGKRLVQSSGMYAGVSGEVSASSVALSSGIWSYSPDYV